MSEWNPQQDYSEPDEKPLTWRQHAKRIGWGMVAFLVCMTALCGALVWGGLQR